MGEELRELPPADQSGRDEELAKTLETMRAQVEARDYRGLESHMVPNFRPEFDGAKGPEAFERLWKAESTSSPVWGLLGRLLSLGGTFYSPSLFAIPYVYTQFPQDLDILGHVVSIRSETNLLGKPEPGAQAIATAGYSILPLATPLKPPALLAKDSFVELNHPAAGQCYAQASDVYSPAGHRMFFELRKGKWRWISFAAATLEDPPELRQPPKGRRK